MKSSDAPNNVAGNELCTGCGACMSICPKSAIVMSFDEDGYLKPKINNLCIHCGSCVKKCPAINPKYENDESPKRYALRMDDDIRSKSTSGGAFSLFALDVLKKGGVVFGASWTHDFNVKIIGIDNMEDLDRLRHSKYVQSDASESYKKVKDLLEKGIQVLYSGCPCQVAGLKSYIGKQYSNLTTIDILCNYVPSIKMFHKYLSEVANIEDIEDIIFRGGVGWNPFHHRIIYKDGSSDLKTKSKGDPYEKAFHYPNLMANEICRYCKFSKIPRQGDITIGDFWGFQKIDASLSDGKGTSVVLINNSKAEFLINNVTNGLKHKEEVPLKNIKWVSNRISCNGNYGPYELRKHFKELLKDSCTTFSDAVNEVMPEKYDVGMVVVLNFNYGNNLTHYALFTYLKKIGLKPALINYIKDSSISARHSFHKFEVNPYQIWEVFNDIESKKELRNMNDKCNTFLLGSDQLLAPNFIRAHGYHSCLGWVYSYKPKIAYAASYGRDEYLASNKFKVEVGEMLRRFDFFSIREESGVELSKKEFDVNATHVLDPVFLLESHDYLEFAKNGKMEFPENYVGAYILDMDENKSKMLFDIEDKCRMPVSLIKDSGKDCRKYSKYGIYPKNNVKVEDWINNVAKCNLFVTDSFHGVCFALIFNKPVIIIKNVNRGATRFTSLSEVFGLQNVLLDNFNHDLDEVLMYAETLDWKKINNRINVETIRSKSWLNKALECKECPQSMDSFDRRWDESNLTEDTKTPFDRNLELAIGGLSSAQRNVAIMYRDDKVIEDLDKAIEWMRRSSDNDFRRSSYELIDMLWKRGGAEDIKESTILLNSCVEGKDHNAMGRLGRAYHDGIGVEKDLDKAINWMSKATKEHSIWTNEYLDFLMERGQIEDIEQIDILADTASKEGDFNIMCTLARAYRDGKGVEKNLGKAVEWMRKAADKNVGWAKNELFDILWSIGTSESYVEMISVATEFADKGDSGAMVRLGRAYLHGKGVEENFNKALELMRKASEKTWWRGRELVDNLLKSTEKEHHMEAFDVCSRLVRERNDGHSMSRLGRMYRDGKGVEKNLDKAAEWMRKAKYKDSICKNE